MSKLIYRNFAAFLLLLLICNGNAFAGASFQIEHPAKAVPSDADKIQNNIKSPVNENGSHNKKELKHLAILNSYNEYTSWSRMIIRAVVSEMTLNDEFAPVDIAHLNNGLIFDEEDYADLQQRVTNFLLQEKPDYLIVIGNFAFTFRDKIKECCGNIPILLISQNDKFGNTDYYFSTKSDELVIPPKLTPLRDLQKDFNFTAVVSKYKFQETVDLMFSMYPDMKKLILLGVGTYTNIRLSFLINEYLQLKYPEVAFQWLIASETEAIIPYLNSNDPSVGLLLSNWNSAQPNLDGKSLFSSGYSDLINGAKRPVFGLRYSYFTYGILGGCFDSASDITDNIILRLSDLLENKNMSSIPILELTGSATYINYPKMIELGIPEKNCPPGTIFYDRDINNWQKYKRFIVIGIILSVLIIISLIVYIITRKRPIIRRDYDNLVNNMPLGFMQVFIILDKDGKITKLEFSEENNLLREIIADHDLKNIFQDYTHQWWQNAVDVIHPEMKTQSFIEQIPDTDTYFEFIITPNKHSTETYLYANVFVLDISDKMKIENVLRDSARKAIEADNMKTTFLANMSHEIRTPLNAIVGFSHLLCQTNDRKKMNQFIDIIETNNQLLLKLIGDILDISKADSDKLTFNMQTVDVNAVIKSVCRSADMTQHPDVTLNSNLPLEKCLVTSDPYRLQQVLGNMLSNALKFTERGRVEVGYREEGKMLRFYVKDTGRGLSESDKTKLFTRFTKLNSFIQGTGLGLSISKAIVEKLGGTMKADSAGRGLGSEFSFTIPYVLNKDAEVVKREPGSKSDEERLADLKKKVNAQSTEFGNIILPSSDQKEMSDQQNENTVILGSYKMDKKKILVVEDNDSNFMLIEAILDNRYELVHALDGEQAVKIFAKEAPDLVLMDINLPIKNGYEATAEIRLISKTVPVIAVTAYTQPTDKEKVIKSGFNGFLAKPIVEQDLMRVLKRFLA